MILKKKDVLNKDIGEQKVIFDHYIDEFNRTVGKDKGIAVKAYRMDNSGNLHNKIIQTAKNKLGAQVS